MTRKIMIFCCLAALILVASSSPIEEVKTVDIVEDVKNTDGHKDVDVENRVQDSPVVAEASDRIDEDIPGALDENVPVKSDKEDLETANTFWGGYYRSPSWGWRRGWGNGGYSGYGGYGGWGYPYYRSYGWGGRGYNNGWGGWGGYNRGWGGNYWR